MKRGTKLAVVDKRNRVMYYVYYYKRDPEDPLGWILVLHRGTQHVSRMSPRWLRRVTSR